MNNIDVNVKAVTTPPDVTVQYKTIILKKHLVNEVNTLTQEMMSAQNTKYVIKYNYVLDGDVTVPENCLLEFDGGSIDNGIIVGDNTIIIYDKPIDEVCPAERQGTFIYNTTVVDEEDITSKSGQIKFKDRPATDGMGRKIFRKNIVEGVNTLTQSMISDANTIYVIQYDFTLGEDITVPENCVLEFDGGSISGEYTLTFQNTYLSGKCNITCNVGGSVINDWVTPQMFGAKVDNVTNDTKAFQRCIEVSDNIYTPSGDYVVTLQYRGASVHNGIRITRSNVYMKFDENAILHSVVDSSVEKPSGGYDGYNGYYGNVIRIRGEKTNILENITIDGGVFIGVRSEFARSLNGPNEENQNAIDCEYTRNTVIKNCTIKDNQGDSVIAYNNYNILVKNIKSYRARRTGVSVGPCEGFVIDNCYFYDNGCDVHYGDKINFGTAPNYAVCLEGDVGEDSLLREFNGVVVKNCYAEYYKHEQTSGDQFIARNQPAFFLSGQLKDGGDNIIIENNTIVNKDNIRGYDIYINTSNSKTDSVIIRNNTLTHIINSNESNCSYILILDCNLKFVEISNNRYTNNAHFAWIYESDSTYKTDTIVIKDNYSINLDDDTLTQDSILVQVLRSSVKNLTIENNIHKGILFTDYFSFYELKELNIVGNIVKSNFRNFTNFSFVGASGNNSIYSARINILNNIFYGTFDKTNGSPWFLFRTAFRYLDANKDITNVEADAVYIETPKWNIQNNTITAIGVGFYISDTWTTFNGIFKGNKIYAPNLNKITHPTIPSESLQITDNIFESLPVNIIDSGVENVILERNTYDNGRVDYPTSGTFAQKPTNMKVGFKYFCTDRQTIEGATDGIEIIYKGNNVWVDTLGRVVS